MKMMLLVMASLPLTMAAQAQARSEYQPPFTRDNQQGVSVWFGEVGRQGHWCVVGKAGFKALQPVGEGFEFGWARYDDRGLASVSDANESEDAFSEDRYFIDAAGKVARLTRTGHYINDPWATVTFTPDAKGRLRLTQESAAVVRKMNAAKYDPYFVKWPHASQVANLPFAKLVGRKAAARVGTCVDVKVTGGEE